MRNPRMEVEDTKILVFFWTTPAVNDLIFPVAPTYQKFSHRHYLTPQHSICLAGPANSGSHLVENELNPA